VLVVVVDLDVLVGPVAGFELVVVVVDWVALEPRAEAVMVVVDLVTSAATPKASSIIVAISMATNIFFISNFLSIGIFMNHAHRSSVKPIICL
jgi:hypothetical protein